jgi:Arc/MetJ-type ribon-helix-helix transcriptional regulator
MIICFECSRETKDALDRLVKTGQYKDYSEAISFAIENLSILQGEIAKNGALVIGQSDPVESSVLDPAPTSRHAAKSQLLESHALRRPRTKGNQSKESVGISEIFLLDRIEGPLPSLAGLPSDVWIHGQNIPIDRWIFGQYNKLLPAKVNCRALAHLLKDHPKGVPIDQAASQIAEEAAILGDFLAHHDEKNRIGRDDALSTAFPSTGMGTEKGRLRYANQFVASVNKQGQVSGLLIDLKLINRTSGKEPRLLLTEVGWNFAILRNAILDSAQETPSQKFTREEIEFLLDHIARSVPAEDFAYRTILSAILNGVVTPEQLDASLQRYIPQDPGRDLSKSFLSSQRSGSISRMADLGLVTRERDGVKVAYIATDSGKQYLQRTR